MSLVLIDRTHKRWLVGSTLTAAMGAAAHFGIALPSIHGPKGGSVLGMLFGILGSACMIFAALLAVRRRLPTLRVGSAQFWLRGHLWLGTLGFVLILFHSGFRWGGLLENLLWISFILVVVTGFFGVILQQVIPRLLTSEVPLETMVSQIPSLSNMSVFKADKIVASKVGVLELEFESLKADALNVLKRQEQTIGERPEDFPRELAKVYANVPLPESNKQHPAVPTVAPIVATRPTPAAVESPPVNVVEAPIAPEVPAAPEASAAKPKSPLEIMREKKAAAQAVADEPTKPKSPIEIMREKKAAAQAAADEPATPKSPIEIMREKKAAAQAAAGEPAKPKSPIEIMREKKAAAQAAADEPATPKTPLEIMREQKGATPVVGDPADPNSLPETLRERGMATLVHEVAEPPMTPDAATPELEQKPLPPIEQTAPKEDPPVGVSLMSGKPMKHLIPITCARCGKMFTVAPRHAGKQGQCPVAECQAPYTVPIPDEPPVELSHPVPPQKVAASAAEKKHSALELLKAKISAAMTMSLRPEKPKQQMISIMCAKCGTIFTVSARHSGKQGRCPVDACQNPYTVPRITEEPVEAPRPSSAITETPYTATIQMRIIEADREAAARRGDDAEEPSSTVKQLPPKPTKSASPVPPSDEPVKPLAPSQQKPAEPVASETPTPAAPEPAKPLSPIEKMRAKKAALAAAAQPASDPAKPLSPIEKMRAKLAAAKGSPADQPEGTPKPLTVEKTAPPPVVVVSPPPIKNPSTQVPRGTAPAKPKRKKVPAPISPELQAVLRDFHIKVLRPFLISGRSPQRRLEDAANARQIFAQLRADLPAELHDPIQQLFVLCEERRQFNTQLRLHRWLHWWLMFHIPPAIAMLVLFAAHVVVALRVVPFVR